MNTETRWTIVENGNTKDADISFTADKDTADYIAQSIAAMNEERGDTGHVQAVRADMVRGPRADLIANVRVAIGELSDAEAILNQAIEKVSNIDAAAHTVHSLASVLADAALKLHEHDELLEPHERGY